MWLQAQSLLSFLFARVWHQPQACSHGCALFLWAMGTNPVPKVTALASTYSKAVARLCLSESTSLESQNKPKLTWAQMPSSVKSGTSWACARREHFVPGKLVKTSGVFSAYSWYSSYSAMLTPSKQEISTQALKIFKKLCKLRLEPYLSASLARLWA